MNIFSKRNFTILTSLILLYLLIYLFLGQSNVLTRLFQSNSVDTPIISLNTSKKSPTDSSFSQINTINLPKVGDEIRVSVKVPSTSELVGKKIAGINAQLTYDPTKLASITTKSNFPGSSVIGTGPTGYLNDTVAGTLTGAYGLNPGVTLQTDNEIFIFSFIAIAESTSNTTSFTINISEIIDENAADINVLGSKTGNTSINIQSGTIDKPLITTTNLSGTNLNITGFWLTGTGGITLTNVKLGQTSIISYTPTTQPSTTMINNQTGFMSMTVTSNSTASSGGSTDVYLVYSDGSQVSKISALDGYNNEPVSSSDMTIGSIQLFPNKLYRNDPNKTALYVKVYHPLGIENIENVKVDLSSIGITSLQNLVPKELIDRSQLFALENITIPTLTDTSSPSKTYDIKVFVYDKFGKSIDTKTTLEIIRNADRPANLGAPVIEKDLSKLSPDAIKPGETFNATIFVRDADGVADIENVYLVDNTLGIGTIKLMPETESGSVGIGKFFRSQTPIKVPETTKLDTVSFNVIASDKTALTNTAQFTLKIQKGKLEIINTADTKPKANPNPVANNNEMEFTISAFVKNENGNIDDVSVTADLSPVQRGVVQLKSVSKSGEEGQFVSDPLTIPTSVVEGNYDITIRATDKLGNNADYKLKLNASPINRFRNRPEVVSGKSYMIPNIIANDGKTDNTLYAYVSDPDGPADIASVVVDLREIGLPPSNAMTPVPNTIQGLGQFFSFTFKVPATTPASLEPYEAVIVATDSSGASSTEGRVNVRILGNLTQNMVFDSPKISYAIATAENTVEVGFNPKLDPTSVSPSGNDFTITKSNNILDLLAILDTTISADGSYVIIKTEKQNSSLAYTVSVSSTVESITGVRVSPGNGDKASFAGYKKGTKTPSFIDATSTTPNTVEIDVNTEIKPSSIQSTNFSLTFDDSSSARRFTITDIKVLNPLRLQITTTENLLANNLYKLSARNIASYSGQVTANLDISFRGYNQGLIGDLNGDGQVDFLDFTIFSKAYTGTPIPDNVVNQSSGIQTNITQ